MKNRASKRNHQSAIYRLFNTIEKNFEADINLLPSSVTTVYGQNIDIESNQTWNNQILFHIPGYSTHKLSIPETIHKHPIIEYSFRLYLVNILESKISFDGLSALIDAIKDINLEADVVEEQKITEAIYSWFTDIYNQSETAYIKLRSALKGYLIANIEEFTPGFKEFLLSFLMGEDRKIHNTHKNLWSTSFDPHIGPYSSQEMNEISCTINNSETLSYYEKSLTLICRDTGLRPIQIALLRTDDLKKDHIGPFISSPKAKGKTNSKLRRSKNNFSDKYINDDTYDHLTSMVIENEFYYQRIQKFFETWCTENSTRPYEIPRALFPKRFIHNSTALLFEHSSLTEYAGHCPSHSISKSISNMTSKLNIQSQRHDSTLYISAYRFRRTLGTQLVLQGYSMEEVAYALDHSTITSVKHYFSWNRDIIDYVNYTSRKSSQIRDSVEAWKGKLVNKANHDSHESIIKINKIDKLGICTKQSKCELHPTISCYSCMKFRPFRGGAHDKALSAITEYERYLSDNSTGAMRYQLIEAKKNAMLIIEAQNAD